MLENMQNHSDIGAPGLEAKKIHALVKRLARPYGIQEFELQFGEDSSGHPGVWVLFHVVDDLNPPMSERRKWTELADTVSKAILNESLGRWPYIKFVQPR